MVIQYRVWVKSLLFAVGIGTITWILLNIIIPGPFHIEESADLYNIKRALVGTATFLSLLIPVSVFRDKKHLYKDEGIQSSFEDTNALTILTLSLRILLSTYLFAFWYMYLPYLWFSQISLSFAYTFPPYYYWGLDGIILLMCICGAYWILLEPWFIFFTHIVNSMTILQLSLVRVLSYMLIIVLFIGSKLVAFPYSVIYIIGVSLFFLIMSFATLLFFRKNYASIHKEGFNQK